MPSFKNIFSSRPEKEEEFYNALKKILGFKPKDLSIYRTAFTHRSMNEKSNGIPQNYERLEFLGDAMLGAVIAAYLYKKVPEGDEGYLTKMRSKVVSREHLNELGKDLNLMKFLKSGVPEQKFGGNIYGNMFESLVGAIYLDRGINYCEKFIHKRVIKPYVDIKKLEGKIISYKSLLIEWCQKEKISFNFDVYEDTGKDEQRHFAVKLNMNGEVVAKARATSKKKAEELAAKRAFYRFQIQMKPKKKGQGNGNV